MDRVLDRLWIGSAEDFRAPLDALGFSGVLDLRDGQAPITDPRPAVHRVDHRDGDPWQPKQVTDALDFVADRIRYGRVLIACAAGQSRSARMTVGYLVRAGWDRASAYDLVRAARPKVAPAVKMLESVLTAVRPPRGTV